MVILLLIASFLLACLIIFLFFGLVKVIEVITNLIYKYFEGEIAFFVEEILFITFVIFKASLNIWKVL